MTDDPRLAAVMRDDRRLAAAARALKEELKDLDAPEEIVQYSWNMAAAVLRAADSAK